MNLENLKPGEHRQVFENADTFDVVRTVMKVSEYAVENDPYITYLARAAKKAENPLLFCFRFCYLSSRFQRDKPNLQTVRTPRAVRNEKLANCVDYSVFLSSLLRVLNIPHSLRISAFQPGAPYAHIYVITKDGTILDPVFGKDYQNDEANINRYFNREVPYHKKLDFRIL